MPSKRAFIWRPDRSQAALSVKDLAIRLVSRFTGDAKARWFLPPDTTDEE